MRRLNTLSLCLLAVALAGLAQARAAEPPSADPPKAERAANAKEPYFTRYQVRFLDIHAAEVLAWHQCPPDAGDRCQVKSATGETVILDVLADTATHRKIAEALAREDAAPHTQTFQVVLLHADDQPGDLPKLGAGAQKALDDLRGFLPYKGYHSLDTAWLRTADTARGRLVGRDGISYSVRLSFKGNRASLGDQLYVRSFEVQEEPLPILKHAPRGIIETSFGLKVGETLVVGTSKLDGGDALVLLVTALPPSA